MYNMVFNEGIFCKATSVTLLIDPPGVPGLVNSFLVTGVPGGIICY